MEPEVKSIKYICFGFILYNPLFSMDMADQGISNWTHLHEAAVEGDVAWVKRLLNVPQNLENIDAKEGHAGRSALWVALHEDQFEAANVLIEAGACVTSLDATGSNAFHYALPEGAFKTLELLFKKGLDTHFLNTKELLCNQDKQTPLHLVCLKKKITASHITSVNLFLEKFGVNLLFIKNKEDKTAVDLALKNEHSHLAGLFIKCGYPLEDTHRIITAYINSCCELQKELAKTKAQLKKSKEQRKNLFNKYVKLLFETKKH